VGVFLLHGLFQTAAVRSVATIAVKKAQLRRVRFHDLRHTFASLLIQHGESLAYVRDQLGHRSIQVTVDIYGHLVPGGNRAARRSARRRATICNPRATSNRAGWSA
jgi:integrase